MCRRSGLAESPVSGHGLQLPEQTGAIGGSFLPSACRTGIQGERHGLPAPHEGGRQLAGEEEGWPRFPRS